MQMTNGINKLINEYIKTWKDKCGTAHMKHNERNKTMHNEMKT